MRYLGSGDQQRWKNVIAYFNRILADAAMHCGDAAAARPERLRGALHWMRIQGSWAPAPGLGDRLNKPRMAGFPAISAFFLAAR
jgi:hypothetical protein